MSGFFESDVEEAALQWLAELDYEIAHGQELEEQSSWGADVVLEARLREAIDRLNPDLPGEAREDAFRKLRRFDAPALIDRNRAFHRMLVDGVNVEFRRADGSIAGAQARVLDFDDPENNDWLAVNQVAVVDGNHARRPDVVIFVNGLPLGLIELKNAADEEATIWTAFAQLQTYQAELPGLLGANVALVISDGLEARIGAIGSGKEWFKPWRTIGGDDYASAAMPELEVLLKGVFEHRRFIDFVRHFVVFEDDAGRITKKLAGYHQFHAVNVAVAETIRAARGDSDGTGGDPGDRRIGVVWHTQGSGKSLTMAFYAGRAILEPAMANPTIVVLTDRNDLDDQLFATFALCRDLLRQPPVQATDRADLRRLLSVASGGVVFSTIQKFLPDEKGDRHPLLSDRSNVVVIADEAHRSQYDFVDGFARHMRDALPNASFIGFTGTPIERADANTLAVFGDTISVYDIKRAVEDKATVPIYYESRLATLELDGAARLTIDPDFEEATEGEEVERKERLKSKWAQLEALVGAEKRSTLIAQDLVEHFERRLDVMEGKAMIVCMSRRICAQLYEAIAVLRPEWAADTDGEGSMKVVMTGSASDPVDWQRHIRSKSRREELANRFRDPDDPFRIVIVRDMWLTGFDAPSLHTMYVDKPMRGHGLMQAIARVNRVFRDKPGGLVVDYLGLADELKAALATYTESGGEGKAALDQAEAVALMLEKVEICRGIFHGFDRSKWTIGTAADRLSLIKAGQEHVLAQPDGKERLLEVVAALSKAFALAVPSDAALEARDEVSFFQNVRTALAKTAPGERKTDDDLDHAVRQIVSGAVMSDGVVDVFHAAGLDKPDISILSDEFLAEVQGMPQRNLAVELLQKLLHGEIRTRSRRNLVQARSFSAMLEEALRRYQNRAIEAAQVIEELIALAKEMREADRRGEELGLTEEEVAFYDALETNDSAVAVLGDEVLRTIARELVKAVRANVTIDWAVRENVRAQLRVIVKRILRKFGYPPDLEERATATVLQQAELIGFERVDSGDLTKPGPFTLVPPDEVEEYVNAIPLYSLAVAAGSFGDGQTPEAESWVRPNSRTEIAPGLFVAQVVGESMNRRIPNGAYCVWRAPVEGSRTGRVVLVESRELSDPETGGSYTVKLYERAGPDLIRLVPDSSSDSFVPIEIRETASETVRVLAELVEVLRS